MRPWPAHRLLRPPVAGSDRPHGGANLAFATIVVKSSHRPRRFPSQIHFPTEYPDGFTTFTPSIATTRCPHLRNCPSATRVVRTSFRGHRSPHTTSSEHHREPGPPGLPDRPVTCPAVCPTPTKTRQHQHIDELPDRGADSTGDVRKHDHCRPGHFSRARSTPPEARLTGWIPAGRRRPPRRGLVGRMSNRKSPRHGQS